MAKDAHLLTDIALSLQDHIPNETYLASFFTVAERELRAPQKPLRLLDFAVTSGRRNLVQAVLMRVLTPSTRAAIEQDLRSLVNGLERPETLHVQVTGESATVTVPGGHQVKLKRDGGVWRVEDFD